MVNSATSLKIIENPEAKKKKKYNKNKKKAWRKRIDLTDIVEAIEDRNREERHGGIIEEKESADIFTLDVGDSTVSHFDKNANFYTVDDTSESTGLKPSNRKLKKKLQCFKYLKGLPGVKPITKKKGTQPQNIPKRIKIIERTNLGNEKSAAALKDVIKNSDKGRARLILSRKKSNLSHKFKKDIWGQDAFYKGPVRLDRKTEVERSYLEAPMQHITQIMRASRKRVPPKRPTDLPAVAIPKPGASYNPTKAAHHALLMSAEDQLQRIKNRRLKIGRIVKQNVPRKDAGITEEEHLKEMSVGLEELGGMVSETEENEAASEVEVESEPEDTCQYRTLCFERKTEKERKRVKTRQIKDMKLKRKKQLIARESEVIRVKKYNKEMSMQEKEAEEEKKKKSIENKKKARRTRVLSKHRFKPMDIAVPLLHEIPTCLLDAKPISNPMDERYQAFTRRSLLEVRPPARPKQKKRKRRQVIKRGAKIDASKYVMPEKKAN